MKTLLRIDASLRKQGSHSLELTEYFATQWQQANRLGRVINRNLQSQQIPHLTDEGFKSFSENDTTTDAVQLSNTLIDEIMKADVVLIGSPLYNLSLASNLKAYFDHIVRAGRTFKYTETGHQGMLNNKIAIVITCRAGFADATSNDDFQTSYLRNILNFIGIGQVHNFSLDGTLLAQGQLQPRIDLIKDQLYRYLRTPLLPVWRGDYSEKDQSEIDQLRQGQTEAILNGDADAYASICDDDIQLMLPGHPAINGKEAFLKVEQAVFSKAQFKSFRKLPQRVECVGDLAFETGIQLVETTGNQDKTGVYSSQQKYTHIFRRTNQGWRFAVLTSNTNE